MYHIAACRWQGGGSTTSLHAEAATDTARSVGEEVAGHIAPSAQMTFGKPRPQVSHHSISSSFMILDFHRLRFVSRLTIVPIPRTTDRPVRLDLRHPHNFYTLNPRLSPFSAYIIPFISIPSQLLY
jgi:hypothetical protein